MYFGTLRSLLRTQDAWVKMREWLAKDPFAANALIQSEQKQVDYFAQICVLKQSADLHGLYDKRFNKDIAVPTQTATKTK